MKGVEKPRQLRGLFRTSLKEVNDLIGAEEARKEFGVSGEGMVVAVLDSGIRSTHSDFEGRVLKGENFTDDYLHADGSIDPNKVDDGRGHGTHVSGIIAANGVNTGIAPEAILLPLKVLRNHNGKGKWVWIAEALKKLNDNRYVRRQLSQAGLSGRLAAVVICVSDGGNYQDGSDFENQSIPKLIMSLHKKGIPVFASSGNNYKRFEGTEGMAIPAIYPCTLGIGAVYDSQLGRQEYASGAIAYSTRADQIAPFSQRLHRETKSNSYTQLFAPGGITTSTGIGSDIDRSSLSGTSQAAPVAAGLCVLLQEYYLRQRGSMPKVEQIVEWMSAGKDIQDDVDAENQIDNVKNTGKTFTRIHAGTALEAARQATKQPANQLPLRRTERPVAIDRLTSNKHTMLNYKPHLYLQKPNGSATYHLYVAVQVPDGFDIEYSGNGNRKGVINPQKKLREIHFEVVKATRQKNDGPRTRLIELAASEVDLGAETGIQVVVDVPPLTQSNGFSALDHENGSTTVSYEDADDQGTDNGAGEVGSDSDGKPINEQSSGKSKG